MNAATKETFPEANFLLTAPPGSEALVFDLAVHHYELGYISRWQPMEAERAAIAAGGPVWVSVWAQGGPPPINVFGVTPFKQQPALYDSPPGTPDGGGNGRRRPLGGRDAQKLLTASVGCVLR